MLTSHAYVYILRNGFFSFTEKIDKTSEDKSVFDRILAVNMKAGMV